MVPSGVLIPVLLRVRGGYHVKLAGGSKPAGVPAQPGWYLLAKAKAVEQ